MKYYVNKEAKSYYAWEDGNTWFRVNTKTNIRSQEKIKNFKHIEFLKYNMEEITAKEFNDNVDLLDKLS